MKLIASFLLITGCYAQSFGLLQMTCLSPVIRLQPFFDSKDRVSNYHGQFGIAGDPKRDPKFQPYSSFIFEDNVFWVGRFLNDNDYMRSGVRRSKDQRVLDCHRAGS